MNDSVRRMLEEQDRLAKLADPYHEIEKVLGHTAADILKAAQGVGACDSTALSVKDHIDREMRRVADMIADVGGYDRAASSITKNMTLGESTRLIAEQLSIVTHPYELPTQTRFQELLEIVNGSTTSAVIAHYHDEASAVKKAMEAIQSPWVDLENELQSVVGFSSLHGIGSVLASHDLYNERVADILRQDLGDWRDEIDWPEPIFSNMLARNAFYIEQGFNPSLVQFPVEAFPEILRQSGIKPERDEVEDWSSDDSERSHNNDLDHEDFQRTNEAHAELVRFENKLRRFVVAKMTSLYGENWVRQRVPGDMQKNWKERREKAKAAGQKVWSEIYYADFGDYKQLIIQKNNWEPLFKTHFGRKELVTESFQRLMPIRNDTMHSRLITQTDELFLYSEITRLLRAID